MLKKSEDTDKTVREIAILEGRWLPTEVRIYDKGRNTATVFVSSLLETIVRIRKITRAACFIDAIETIGFHLSEDVLIEKEVSILIDVFRMNKDGQVYPPLDFERLYKESFKLDTDTE